MDRVAAESLLEPFFKFNLSRGKNKTVRSLEDERINIKYPNVLYKDKTYTDNSKMPEKLKQTDKIMSIVASGPAIIKDKTLLVVLDDEDPFLKLPGGKLFEGKTLRETCLIETKLEIGCDIEIIRELEPMLLWKKPHTGEDIAVLLIHWLVKLKDNQIPKKGEHVKEILWINSDKKTWHGYKLGPNVDFLLKKLKEDGLID